MCTMSTPNEKISTLVVYLGLASIASGGMKVGVPATCVCVIRAEWVGLKSRILATPRSEILAVMLVVRRMLLDDRSRWMMGGENSWR